MVVGHVSSRNLPANIAEGHVSSQNPHATTMKDNECVSLQNSHATTTVGRETCFFTKPARDNSKWPWDIFLHEICPRRPLRVVGHVSSQNPNAMTKEGRGTCFFTKSAHDMASPRKSHERVITVRSLDGQMMKRFRQLRKYYKYLILKRVK